MRSMTHILILTECRYFQLFTFFMPIIGFLPDNRKKRVRIRINSYDSQWLEDKKTGNPEGPLQGGAPQCPLTSLVRYGHQPF